MSKVIVGIHGLANKPERKVLSDWWKNSLVEGLANVGAPNAQFDFRLVYWADLLYSAQLHSDPLMDFDALYNEEPYLKAELGSLEERKESWWTRVEGSALAGGGGALDFLKREFGMDSLADWALGKLLKDLAFYYDGNRKLRNRQSQPELARKVLCDELKMALREEAAKGSEILVLAHSMGTIISYDSLRDLGREPGSIEVAEFVTIGSPLGLPHVKANIMQERGYDPRVRTPSIVKRGWVNFADRKDPVALDTYLKGDYQANDSGIEVVDDLVLNDYCTVQNGEKKFNHHKSYGYLRTPELSKYVKGFLEL